MNAFYKTQGIGVLENGTALPIKTTEDALGYDVRCTRVESDPDGRYVECFTGKHSYGLCGYFFARSSITKTGWMLANGVGVLDSDYTGEWRARFVPVNRSIWNLFGIWFKTKILGQPLHKAAGFPYQIDDRVMQFVPVPMLVYHGDDYSLLPSIKELPDTDRGEGGFGSTGL